MRALLAVICAISGGLTLLGYLGMIHPGFDSISVFRWPLLGLTCGLTMVLRPWRLRVFLQGVFVTLLLLQLWPVLRPDWRGTPQLTVLQHNLLFSRDAAWDRQWLAKVRELSPDVLTLQEVSPRNLALYQALSEAYPYQLHCPLYGRLGEGVLSRYPFVPGSLQCSQRDGVAVARIAAPQGEFTLISLHIGWPWPYRQPRQLRELMPELRGVTGPVVIAGDFNSVAWSHTVSTVSNTVSVRRVGRQMASFNLPFGGLPVGIDHVLSSGPGRVRRLPKLGSDHHAIWAELDPWRR